jgi:uncharacterized protein (TIGR03435 family)
MFRLQHLDKKILVDRKFLSVLGATVFIALISIGAIAQVPIEQSRPQQPSFEVASIRVHDPNDSKERDNYQAYPGGRFTSSNASLWMLIHYAFQLQPYQITGIPGWIKSEHYDVDAKPAEAHSNFDDIPLMLQGVLGDRFQLKYHWETREQPVYDLVVMKPGKLRASILKGDCPPYLSNPEWPPKDAPCGGLANSPGHTKGYNLTASDLAGSLSWLLSKHVSDKTNLAGRYDVELRWTPESIEMRSDASSEQDDPNIFTAIQEQLGLKLKPARGPVRVFVIDHVEKLSGN